MSMACKGMMEKPGNSLWMIVPALALVGLGIAIIFYPQILVWLVSVVLISMGLGMLMMANFMRGIGRRMRDTPH